jgi:hypothetical protein
MNLGDIEKYLAERSVAEFQLVAFFVETFSFTLRDLNVNHF